MQIKIGTYYVNKTWKYLRPCLIEYGTTFHAKYGGLFKLAVGIHDAIFNETQYEQQKLIYILVDKKYRPNVSENILQWMSYQKFFVTQYPYDDIIDGRKQMIVLRIPEKYHNAYDEFKKGNYSRMYTDEQIELLFPKSSSAKNVLVRNEQAYQDFIKKVNNNFGTSINKSDLYGAELDFPIEQFKEVFNCTP